MTSPTDGTTSTTGITPKRSIRFRRDDALYGQADKGASQTSATGAVDGSGSGTGSTSGSTGDLYGGGVASGSDAGSGSNAGSGSASSATPSTDDKSTTHLSGADLYVTCGGDSASGLDSTSTTTSSSPPSSKGDNSSQFMQDGTDTTQGNAADVGTKADQIGSSTTSTDANVGLGSKDTNSTTTSDTNGSSTSGADATKATNHDSTKADGSIIDCGKTGMDCKDGGIS